MKLDEYTALDGIAIADLVKKGEVSTAEVAGVAMEAIDAVNPQLNAVIETYPERVDQTPADGPLKGVPFLLKDLVVHEGGKTNELGSRLAKGMVSPHDSELAIRYRNSGLNILGRTTTPELGFCATSEALLYGASHNPWNLNHSPGGSSGGSAAMVAARAVPAAHANDGGGSVRIPAANCGLVGMKPTRARVSLGPDAGEAIGGFAIEHVVSRTVRDSAALLDATQGVSPGDPYIIAPPSRPYLGEVVTKPKALKIAMTTEPWSGDPVDPECVAAVHETAKRLQGLGHEVVEASPVIDYEPFIEATANIWAAGETAWVLAIAAATGRTPGPDNLETSILATYEAGMKLSAMDYLAALGVINTTCRAVGPFFDDYDMLLTPTCGKPAWELGEMDANKPGWDLMSWTRFVFGICSFTPLFNATGHPAVSLPLAMSKGGLPIGIQFVGQWGREDMLYQLSGQLEEAHPWIGLKPPVCAG
jgi:amidase